MDKVRYYDIRCVNGDTTSIQIENGSVENAGSSYYGKALIRVLGENGWGYCCVSPFDMDDAKAKEAAIEKAALDGDKDKFHFPIHLTFQLRTII